MNHAWHGLLPSDTAIQPLVVGDNATALALANGLQRAGLRSARDSPAHGACMGTARLRFTLSAVHQAEDVAALVRSFAKRGSWAFRAMKPESQHINY